MELDKLALEVAKEVDLKVEVEAVTEEEPRWNWRHLWMRKWTQGWKWRQLWWRK